MTQFRAHRRPIAAFLTALMAFWQVAQPLQAATVYWDGSSSASWSTAANWNAAADGTGADVAFANGNDLVFIATGGANLTTTLGGNRTVRSLSFNSTLLSNLAINNDGTNARTLTITPTGTGLTPAGIGIDMTGSGADVSIGVSTITLGADQTWLLGTGRTLTVTSAFTADAADDLIIDGAGTFRLGNITDNSYSINSFTLQNGATMVNTQDNAFGDTTTTIIMNAGTTWDKGNFTDAFRGLSGTGTIINAGNLDFRAVTGDTFTFSGTVSGPATADLIKQGQTQFGTQIIAGDVSFQDQLLVYSGTLALSDANGAANQITGTLLLGRSDASTVRDLSNPQATLRLDSTANNHVAGNRLHDDETMLFRSTGHLHVLGNATTATTENIGIIEIQESNGVDSNAVITLEDAGAGVELTSNSLTRSAGGTLLIRGTGLGTGALGAGVSRLIFDVAPPVITGTAGTPTVGIIAGVFGDSSAAGAGAGLVTYGSDGVRLLTAAEFASAFAGAGENIKLTANQTLAGPISDLTATLEMASLDLGASMLTLSNASIFSGGASANTISNGSISFGAATEGFIYTPQDLTLSAAIIGATALTKAGAGKLTISTAQSYTGATSITQGTVDIVGSFILPTGRLNVDNATLNLTGSGTYNRVGHLSGSWNSTVNLNDNALELVGTGDISYYGQINGSSSSTLIKSGTNIWTQRSLNSSFSGNVIVRGGTFRLLGDTNSATSPAAGTLSGAVSFLVETGGILSLDNQLGTDSRAISDRIGNSASISLNRGTFVITGSNNARPSETVGALNLVGGYNTITLDADFGANSATNTSHGDVVLTAASLNRSNFSTALVRGDNLGFAIGGTADNTTAANTTGGTGGDPGGSESNLNFTSAPTLSGNGSGMAVGIIPYLTGGVTASSTGNSLLTIGSSGVRLLDFSPTTTDYYFQAFATNAALAAAAMSGNNVYLDITANNSDPQLDGSVSIGGLVLDNTGGTGSDLLLQGNQLTVAGGIILSTGSQTNTITGGAGGSITFGNNDATGYEGRIHGARRIEIGASIVDNGSNAVSVTTDGEVYYTVAQQYTGNTVINSGRIEISGGDDLMPVGTVLTVNGNSALRLFGGSQQIAGLQGIGFVENQNTTVVRTLTINAASDYTFNGVLRNGATAALNIIKQGIGTQTLSGISASTATGSIDIHEGKIILDGGITSSSGQVFLDNRIATTVALTLGSGTVSGVLQIGGASGALVQSVGLLATSGTGMSNAVVGGNSTLSTFTINQDTNTTFSGNLGGAGANENALNLVKAGAGELGVIGNATYTGTTTITGGKLTLNGSHNLPGALNVTSGELRIIGASLLGTPAGNMTVGNGASLIFNHGSTNQTFSGAGNVLSLDQSSLTTQLGFGLSGATSDRLTLGSGQTLSVSGLIDTVIVVGSAPTVLTDRGYLLIDSAVDGAFTGTGSFQIGAIENAGNFIYNVAREVTGSDPDRLYLTVTANNTPPPDDAWWKGDLTGPAAGSWTAVQLGGNSNWDTSVSGGVDAAVPPGTNSHVHFSATGAANFATQLLSPLTIKALTFHADSGTNGVSIGGIGPLTIGNGIDTPTLDVLTSGNSAITISVPVVLGASQAWNVADAGSVLTLSGGISGTGNLSINSNGMALGTVQLGGVSSTFIGNTLVAAGRLVLEGVNALPTSGNLTIGSANTGAVLQLGTASATGNAQIGEISEGLFGGNSIVGGAATASTLTIVQSSSGTFNGVIGGAGTNENQLALVKQGAASLVLQGANTYTGGTIVNAGTLQIGAAGSITGALTVNASAGATAVFDLNGRTITLSGLTLGGADSMALANIADTATGGVIALTGNVLYDATNNPLGSTIDADFTIANDPRSFIAGESASAATELTINGMIAATGYATDERVTFDGLGVIVLNGAVSVAGSGSDLQKNGAGTLSINAATSAADDWVINEGVINANVSNALNAADDIIIDGTGAQDSAIVNIGGTSGASGVAQGDDLFIRNGGRVNVLVSGAITSTIDSVLVGDSASVGDAGAGRLDLAADITHAGALQVGASSGGHLGNITGTGVITSGSYSLRGGSIGAGITLAGTGSITKTGNGTLTFAGTRSTIGSTSIQNGHLVLDYSSNNNSKIGGVLTLGTANANVTSPTSLTLDANTAGTMEAVTSTTIERSADVSIFLNDAGGGVTLDLQAITRAQLGGTVSFQYSTMNAAVATTSADTSALGWATVTGGGTTRFAAISGGMISQAASVVQNSLALWMPTDNIVNSAAYSGSIGANSTVAITSLAFDAAAASTITIGSGGVLALASGGILVNESVGANSSNITGGFLVSTASAPAAELIVHQNNTAGSLTIASSLFNSGGVTKSGEGLLVLSGNNTFISGSRLTINEGTVQLGGGNAVGDSTLVLMRSGTTLDLNNSVETIGNIGIDTTNTSSGTIAIGSGMLTVNQGTTAIFAGGFTGSGTLVKMGAGTLELNGSSGFTGSVVINAGRLELSGSGGFLASAGTFTLNGPTAELLSNQDDATERNRIGQASDIILNNTAGANGLYHLTNQGNTKAENIGDIRVGAGHNVVTSFGNATNAIADLISDTLLRLNTASQNHGTLLVRGNALGATSGTRGQIRFDSGAQATIDGYEVGDASNTGTKIKIIPWIVGDLSQAGLGNTFVTNTGTTNGLRPLAAGEYVTNETSYNALVGVVTDNVRFDTNPGAALTGPSAINSLVLDGAAAITLTGPAAGLEIATGAILSAQGVANIIDGFTGLTTGGGRDYTIFVTAGAGTLRLDAPLTSTVALVKAGAGTLNLSNSSNAFTDLYLNQGFVQVDAVNKLGTGTLNFFGGGVRLAAGFVDDLSTKTWDINTGGGLLDASLVTGGTTLVNGIDDASPSADDILTVITRSTATDGLLTIQGSSSFTGTTVFNHTSINSGAINSVVLNGDTNAAISGNLIIGNTGAIANNNFDVTLALGASEQIIDTASITFNSTSGEEAYFKLMGFTETVAGISAASRGVIENHENDTDVVGTDGKLIVNSADDYSYTGFLRNRGSGSGTSLLAFEKQGSGTQTLVGASITYTGTTTITGGALQLRSVSAWGSAIVNNATLILDETADRTHAQDITGTGSVFKLGNTVLTLSGANVGYTGGTVVRAGSLNVTGGNLATTSLQVDAGATLNLLNNSGAALNLTSLELGSGNLGPITIGLELGSLLAFDRFIVSGAAVTKGSVVLNLAGLAGLEAGAYDLFTATAGLDGATYSIGTPAGGFTYTLATDPTFVRLTATAIMGPLYWSGGINTSWSAFSSGNTNWTTDLAGTINAHGTPGAANSVIFSAQNAAGPSIATTLDGLFTINDLQFTANPTGVTDITIAAGTGGGLTIAPSLVTAGISVADNAGAITISAPVVLGGDQTWDVTGTGANGSSLTVSGVVSGTGNLTKTGAGMLTLSNAASTYAGSTTVNAGVLQAGVANGFNNTSAHVINGTGILRLNNFSATIGSLAGVGTVENSGAGTDTLTVGGDNTSTTFSGVLQDGASGLLGLTKVGTGTLTLSGMNTHTGTTTVRNGVLVVSGVTNTSAGVVSVGDSAGARGTLRVIDGGDLTTTDIDFGSNATGAGAGYQTGGSMTITGADATNRFTLGNVAGGYGYYELSGGTLSTARLTVSGNNFANATGVYVQTGGIMNVATWSVIGHGSGNALVDISGGTYNAAGSFALNHVSNAYSVVNVRGTGTINRTGTSISLMQGNANSVNNVGIMNLLAGGTLRTNSGGIIIGAGTGSSGNLSLLNLNGGTIVTNAASTTLFNVAANAAHLAATGTYLYSGGVTVDTNGFNSTIPVALLAPSGEGVQSIAVASEGGGYIGAPLIKITGGSGVGATAIANMVDDGSGNGTFKIGSITVTNPGTGYQNSDVLTVAFADNAGAYTTQATLGAVTFNGGNTSGGLTKTGTGVLTLSGASSYTGATTVNAGTLALGANNVLADAGTVLVNGGVFDVNTRTDTVSGVTLQSGAITGTTGILTSTSIFDLQDGTATAILAGAVGVSKTTAGTVVLGGANTFTGAVSVTGGTLAFSTAANLGDASMTNTVTVNGGTLSYEGTGAVDLGVTRGALVIGANDATLNAASSTGVLTISGGLNGSSGGDLIKTGSGSVIIGGGAVDLNGGSVNVTAGLLSAGFTGTGASAVTVSGSGTLHLVDNAATTLALGAGALNLADGARLGFELGTTGMPGTSDLITLSGAANVAGTITLDFFNLGTLGAGTYNLLQAASGLDAANYVLGNAPTGFNYTINKSGNLVSISTEVLIARYWKGLANGSWSTVNVGPNFNWSSLADGSDDSAAVPGAGQTVIFSATNAAATSITTTLDGDFTIDSLQFKNAPSGVTDVTINQGASGTLTLMPASSTNGILVEADAGLITISAPLVLGAAQTWNVSSVGDAALVVSGGVTFNNGLTKTGAGALTLSGANTGAGGVTLISGTLNINSTTAIGSGALSIGAGTSLDNSTMGAISLTTAPSAINLNGSFTFTGTQDLDLGTGDVALNSNASVTTSASTLTLGGSLSDGVGAFDFSKLGSGTLTINGASNEVGGTLSVAAGTLNMNNGMSSLGTLSVSGGTVNLNGANTVAGAVSISGGITSMNGGNTLNGGVSVTAGTLTMNGANTITGSVVNAGGTVTLGGANSISGGVTNTSGTLNINNAGALGSQLFTINGGTINNTSGFAIVSTTNNAMAWNSSFTFTGGSSLDLGTGAVTLGNSTSVTVSANTLTVGGVIDDDVNSFNLTKLGNGSLVLNGQSTYSGTTTIQTGTVILGVNDALPVGTVLTVGASTTAGILDLNGFNQTIGSLLVRTNNNAVTNNIIVDAANTLTVNGAVTIGVDANESDTNLNASGGGAIVVNSGNANFQVGGATGGTNENRADVDFSGLASFTANLGTGTFRLGDNNTGTGNSTSTFKLATNNVITAANIRIGDGTGGGNVHTLTLGSGTNDLYANTINVGSAGANIRSSGLIIFDAGDSTGEVRIRASDGSGRAAINMVNTTGNTATNITSTINFNGHTSNILASTLTMASRTMSANAATATLSFNQGVLDVTTLAMASRTGSGTGNADATLNIGGGMANFGSATLAVNTSSGGTVAANLNVTGGTVTFGTGSPTAINMANAGTGRTVTSHINLTGGTVNVSGNIIRQGGAGTENATVTLNGSTLDMGGNNIGTDAANVAFNAESGTLKNLAQLNGGGTLTKTTTGLLILEGTNTYTGATDVNVGILQVGTAGAGQSGSGIVTVASGATLAGTGMVAGSATISSGAVLQAGDVTMAGDATSTVTSNGTLTFTPAGTALTIQDGGQIRLGVSSPTLDNTVISFNNGVFTFNGTDYNTAKDLFDNEATALTLWNVAPASQANHDFINLTGMGSTLSIGDRASGTFGDGSVLVGGMLGSVQAGQVFNLIDWSGAAITGNFDVGGINRYDATNNVIAGDLDLMSLGAGFGYDVSAFTTYGIVVVVPEPSRALLLMLGLLGLMLRRRRRA